MEVFEVQENNRSFKVGIKYGIIAALAYIILLLFRYNYFYQNPMMFTGSMFFSYAIIVVIIVMAGLARRRELGGYAGVKEIFSTIFVVILFAEFTYLIFNFIYLNYIDPNFHDKFLVIVENYLDNLPIKPDNIDEQINQIREQENQKMSLSSNLKGIAWWIVVDSILGLLISFFIRKPKPIEY